MGVLKTDLGDVQNLTNWKAKQLLNNVVLGSLAPFHSNTFYFIYGITNPTLWWDLTFESANMKEEAIKEVKFFVHTIHLAPSASTSTNPKPSKKNARKV
jgi:hypothetical protein